MIGAIGIGTAAALAGTASADDSFGDGSDFSGGSDASGWPSVVQDIPPASVAQDIPPASVVQDIPPVWVAQDIPSPPVVQDIPPASVAQDIPPASVAQDIPSGPFAEPAAAQELVASLPPADAERVAQQFPQEEFPQEDGYQLPLEAVETPPELKLLPLRNDELPARNFYGSPLENWYDLPQQPVVGGNDLGSGDLGAPTPSTNAVPLALALPAEFRLSPEDRATINGQTIAENIDSTQQLTGVPTDGKPITQTHGPFTVGSPAIDTRNAGVNFDDGNVTFTGVTAHLGGLGLKAGGRDQNGFAYGTETQLTFDRQGLPFGFPNDPGPAGRRDVTPPGNVQGTTTNRVGFTEGSAAPTTAPTGNQTATYGGSGVTVGFDSAGKVVNLDGGVGIQGSYGVPITIYAGEGSDGPGGGYRVGGNVTVTPVQGTFGGQHGPDQSSAIGVSGEAKTWDGPRLTSDGRLVTDGLRTDTGIGIQYNRVDGVLTPVGNSRQVVEADTQRLQIGATAGAQFQNSSRPENGLDVDVNAQARLNGGYQHQEITTPLGNGSAGGFYGNGAIRADVRAGDLTGRDQFYVQAGGNGQVTYTDQNGTNFSGTVTAGIGGKVDGVDGRAGVSYQTSTNGPSGFGYNASLGVPVGNNTQIQAGYENNPNNPDGAFTVKLLNGGGQSPAPTVQTVPPASFVPGPTIPPVPNILTFDPNGDFRAADVPAAPVPGVGSVTVSPAASPAVWFEPNFGNASDLAGTTQVGIAPQPAPVYIAPQPAPVYIAPLVNNVPTSSFPAGNPFNDMSFDRSPALSSSNSIPAFSSSNSIPAFSFSNSIPAFNFSKF